MRSHYTTKLLNDAILQKDRLSRDQIFGRVAYGERATRDRVLERVQSLSTIRDLIVRRMSEGIPQKDSAMD